MRVLTRSGLLAAGWEPSRGAAAPGHGAADAAAARRLRRRPARSCPTPRVLHEARVRAAVQAMSDQAVVSHVSAAVLHGFELWRPDLRTVHVTRDRGRGGRIGADVHVTPAPLDAEEVVLVDGVPVTSPARTLVDLVRGIGFEQGVVAADFALRSGIVDVAGLQRGARAGRAAGPGSRGRVGSPRSRTRAARASASPAAGWRSPAPACRCRGPSSRSWTTGTSWSVGATSGGRRSARSESSTAGSSTGGDLRPGPGPRRGGVRREGARGRAARLRARGRALDLGRAGAVRSGGRPDPACARSRPAPLPLTHTAGRDAHRRRCA